jgi:hypothetical protein
MVLLSVDISEITSKVQVVRIQIITHLLSEKMYDIISAFGHITYDPNIKAVCRDGSYSAPKGRGTCSHHGGVDHCL